MSLLTFSLVLAVLKNYVIICSACSLLPGGSPPCFPNAVDSNANEPQKIKDFTYELPKNKVFKYSVTSSNVGPARLGQSWQEVIGTDSDTVVCERNTADGAYLSEFETKLWWRCGDECSSMRQKWTDGEYYDEVDVNSHFVITKREVWHCRGEENTQTSSLDFLRIVTELLAVWPVKELYFQDGIQVVFVPSLRYEDKAESLLPIVREIKYLDPLSYNVLKYEGHLKLIQSKKEEEYSIFEEIHQNHPVLKQGSNQFKEVHSPTECQSVEACPTPVARSNIQKPKTPSHKTERLTEISFPDDGSDLVELEPPTKTIGTSDDVAICKISAKDPKLYTSVYLTKWAEKDVHERTGLRPFRDFTYQFRFVATKHEVWTCKTKKSKETFVRSIAEYVGKYKFKSVQYSNQIDLWKFLLIPRRYTQSIAVRDITYFNDKSERVLYEGWIEEQQPTQHLMDRIVPAKFVKSSSKEKSLLPEMVDGKW